MSQASQLLLDAIDGANFLPDNFPEVSIRETCFALKKLKDGTAEGSRPALEYARVKLPRLRRHIVGPLSAGREADEPFLERGGPIDLALADLIACTTTALDAYREQASEPEEILSVEDIEIPASGIDLDSIKDTANTSQAQSSEALNRLNKIPTEGGKLEKFKRRILDVETLSHTISAEANSTQIIPKLLKWLGTIINNMPNVILRLGKTIEIGADIAEPYAQVWNDFNTNSLNNLISAIKGLGSATTLAGKTLSKQVESKHSSSNNLKKASFEEKLTTRNYKEWIRNYVRERGSNRQLSVSLLTAEIAHQAGTSTKDFSKKLGYKNFSSLINSISGLVIVAPYIGSIIEISDKDYTSLKIKSVSTMKGEVINYINGNADESGFVNISKLVKYLQSSEQYKLEFAICCGVLHSSPKQFLSSHFLIEYANPDHKGSSGKLAKITIS